MTTLSDYQYSINGVIATDRPVMENMERLASAAGSWVTYDINQGKWAVIINRTGNSVRSFTDSNMIGSIGISGTSLTELYNSVRVEFPHTDLRDQTDYISLEIPDADRNDNEPDNQLNISYDIVTDPVQAELLGLIELKQSRVDQIIRFVTDFSSIGLRAGDLIDVTSDVYGLVNQMYRIIAIDEQDGDDGSLNLSITALAYDAAVYDQTDIVRYGRSTSTGISSIGNIGKPSAPTVTTVSNIARPHVLLEALAPTGIVERMEFWITNDVPPAVVNDENRNYRLIGTRTPATGTSTFTTGQEVELDIGDIQGQNFLSRVRGINSTTAGPYSDPSGIIYYAPTQVTDAIGENTGAINSDGTSALVNALGVLTLINKLSGLFSSNSSAGGLFKQVFDVFTANTGYNILQDANNIKSAVAVANNPGTMISAASGKQVTTSLAQTTFLLQMGSTVTFTPPYTGTYKIDVLIDQNFSGAEGGRGDTFSEPDDDVNVGFDLTFASNNTSICTASSGGTGANFWTDFVLTNVATLNNTTSYNLKFYYVQDTESNPTASASFDISYNVVSVSR